MNHKSSIITTILIIIFLVINAIPINAEKITGFINDYANIIDEDDENTIEKILQDLYDSNIAQIAIFTINTTGDEPIEDYSLKLAHERLGDSELDNGLL